MLVIGTKGLAKDLIGAFKYETYIPELYFFDNVDPDTPEFLYNKFKVYKTFDEIEKHFKKNSKKFIAAIGSPKKRYQICNTIKEHGGEMTSFVSAKALISNYSEVKKGVIVQLFCSVSSDVFLDEGCFINVGSILGHDVAIGKYTTISPAVKILGNARIGDFCVIGTNSVIMPNVTIGNNVKIGVGKIIENDIPDNTRLF